MSRKVYKHIFFDLDHTLWDFEKNCEEALWEIFTAFGLKNQHAFTFEHFISTYRKINTLYWKKYRDNLVTKNELRIGRFRDTLLFYQIEDEGLANRMADEFVNICPKKTNLFPHAAEMLAYLNKNYHLHIITNGFKESQHIKLSCSGIRHYFTHIITSEEVQSKKPDIKIFNYSLEKSGAKSLESLMIGDNLEADIIGARNAKIDQLYFNPGKFRHPESITYEINCLSEITHIL